jgi:hypothetical protein
MTFAAARVTAAAEGLPRRRFTVGEAMVAAGVMDEDERVELIGGAGAQAGRTRPRVAPGE